MVVAGDRLTTCGSMGKLAANRPIANWQSAMIWPSTHLAVRGEGFPRTGELVDEVIVALSLFAMGQLLCHAPIRFDGEILAKSQSCPIYLLTFGRTKVTFNRGKCLPVGLSVLRFLVYGEGEEKQ